MRFTFKDLIGILPFVGKRRQAAKHVFLYGRVSHMTTFLLSCRLFLLMLLLDFLVTGDVNYETAWYSFMPAVIFIDSIRTSVLCENELDSPAMSYRRDYRDE